MEDADTCVLGSNPVSVNPVSVSNGGSTTVVNGQVYLIKMAENVWLSQFSFKFDSISKYAFFSQHGPGEYNTYGDGEEMEMLKNNTDSPVPPSYVAGAWEYEAIYDITDNANAYSIKLAYNADTEMVIISIHASFILRLASLTSS